MTDGTFVRETNCPARAVRAITEDENGDVWFGGDDGLARWHSGHFENLTGSGRFPADIVSALCSDKKTLWIGTSSDGLFRWRNGHWDRFDGRNGLFSNEILAIAEDQGWLWLTSTKGVFRLRERDLEMPNPSGNETVPCITYGKADGLESIVCGGLATPAIWKTGDDRLCFATTKGLAIINARDAKVDLAPPPVYIEQVEIDRKPVSFSENELLTIPPNRGELDIHYTALDLRAPEKPGSSIACKGWTMIGLKRARCARPITTTSLPARTHSAFAPRPRTESGTKKALPSPWNCGRISGKRGGLPPARWRLWRGWRAVPPDT
jgi:ligand-binding sensor domain-containing protein